MHLAPHRRLCRRAAAVAPAAVLLLAAQAPALARPADLHPTNPSAVVVALSAMPQGTDPLTTDDQYSADVESVLYDPLYYVTPTLAYAPDLATSWQVSRNGLAYTYALNPKARWTNGRPVTAADVVYSLEAYAGPQDTGALEGRFADLASVAAVGQGEVRVLLRRPDAAWPGLLADLAILPRPLPPAGAKAGAAKKSPAPTDGPYMVMHWDASAGSILLGANPAYFRGAPHISRIEVRVVASAADALAGLRHGTIQVAMLPPSVAASAGKTPTLRLHVVDGLSVTLVAFNVADRPLEQGGVRRALTLAVNREALIAALGLGTAAVPVGPWPAGLAATPAAPMAFDPALAARLLAAAGWRLGRSGARERAGVPLALTLRYAQGVPAVAQAAAIVVRDWRAVGVDARAVGLPFATVRADAVSGRYQAILTGVAFGPGASAGALVAGRSAWPPAGDDVARYADPVATALVATLSASADTAAPSQAALAALSAVLDAGPPYLPLWTPCEVFAASATLSGFVANPAGPDLYQPEAWTVP